MPKPIVISHHDKQELADKAAERLIQVVNEAVARQGIAHLSLTGGTMGIKIWDSVKNIISQGTEVDWSKVHFWWSDERFVETGHADRNEQQAKNAFLENAEIPQENLHIMGASDQFDTVDDAAAAYTAELQKFAAEESAVPHFDLTLLGMGPDGHIASLFPNRTEILDEQVLAISVENSPKPPPTRVSLTLPAIRNSDSIWFLIAGSDKAGATARLVEAAERAEDELTADVLQETPAAGARGLKETLILATEDSLS